MVIRPVQSIRPAVLFKNVIENDDDGDILDKKRSNSQIIECINSSFTGHWPQYIQPPIIYYNHPEPLKGDYQKLDFIA